MEYFFISLLLILLLISGYLYQKLSWFKKSYDSVRAELSNKISDFLNLAEKCKEESSKFQEVSAKNINLIGKYQELLRNSQMQSSKIDGLNLKINDLLEKQAAEIKNARIDANMTQRAVLRGKISEEIVPLLPNFPYEMSCLKFMGAPIDYIVYPGINNEDIQEIVFLEVKTSKAVLNNRQKQIKKIISEGKVRFEVYRTDDINTNNIKNDESN